MSHRLSDGHLDQHGLVYVEPSDGSVWHSICVSDIVKLAAAGVTMSFNDIKNQVIPDGPSEPRMRPIPLIDDTLAQALWSRVATNLQLIAGEYSNLGFTRPYQLAAAKFEETIYVFAVAPGHPPVILTDPAHCFPSDALMAKLALLKDQAK